MQIDLKAVLIDTLSHRQSKIYMLNHFFAVKIVLVKLIY